MVISVASGKGGTGKTTVSIALAQSLPQAVNLIDCDVEEPNVSIFLPIRNIESEKVHTLIPQIDSAKCTACGKCASICRYNALANLKNTVMVFPELCHSCGGCSMICPHNAITEVKHQIGELNIGDYNNIKMIEGRLDIGQIVAPAIIRKAKSHIEKGKINIIDSPPGAACPMVTAIKDTDYTILVTESTPFGLNDLIIAIDTLKELKLPFSVIINKDDKSNTLVEDYCRENSIDLIAKIPDSVEIARAYSEGKTMIDAMPELKEKFLSIINKIENRVKNETNINN